VGGAPGVAVGGAGVVAGGLDDDGLELLGAADAAGAAAAGGAVVLVNPAGEADGVFAGLADGHDAEVIGAVALLEDIDGFVDALAPEVGCVLELDHAVVDVGVDGLRGDALEDKAIEAGPAEAGSAPAALVAIGDGAGERALGDDGEAAAHRGFGAGERAVHEAEDVVGAERVDAGSGFEDVTDADAAGADVLAGPLFGDWRVADGPAGEVDGADTAGIATECHELMPPIAAIRPGEV